MRASPSGRATNALAAICRLYAIESETKQLGLDLGKRRERRQQECKPLLDQFKPWLEGLKPTVLPKSPMGDAIGYVLRQWDPQTQYLDDGRLDIDNNRVERQMRAVAVGRKNCMYTGSDAGARRAATIYPLVCTCGLLGVEPWAYLKDVLQRIAEGEDPAQLTPRLWKAAGFDGRFPATERGTFGKGDNAGRCRAYRASARAGGAAPGSFLPHG